MMLPKSDVGSSSMVAQSVLGAPSCTRSDDDVDAVGLEVVGLALTASTMSVTSMSVMPPGDDQLGQVLGDGADEADLDAVRCP